MPRVELYTPIFIVSRGIFIRRLSVLYFRRAFRPDRSVPDGDGGRTAKAAFVVKALRAVALHERFFVGSKGEVLSRLEFLSQHAQSAFLFGAADSVFVHIDYSRSATAGMVVFAVCAKALQLVHIFLL